MINLDTLGFGTCFCSPCDHIKQSLSLYIRVSDRPHRYACEGLFGVIPRNMFLVLGEFDFKVRITKNQEPRTKNLFSKGHRLMYRPHRGGQAVEVEAAGEVGGVEGGFVPALGHSAVDEGLDGAAEEVVDG